MMAMGWAQSALALDPRYPDWPCQQLKVPEISIASVWNGPPIDAIDTTKPADPKQAELVAHVAARRTPIEDARKLIGDYLVGTEDEKQQKAIRLFAALYSTLNAQRDQVIAPALQICELRTIATLFSMSSCDQPREWATNGNCGKMKPSSAKKPSIWPATP